ncbi:FAD:protein FMN transferase [Luteolibacter sp. SL250]|uniref:FAD:protein FMN transferase n=1 Tax=Luteolibacter sp. SL250 TaxID=2995170 RepID=UPI0022709B18|nr:FAD:protein FMN transferase [Luteolibacter sp. SL250]WAC21824.1 FAD:protein FMN transferase [Luteolibacter sp. SL250]
MSFRFLLLVLPPLLAALPASAEKFRFERPLMGTRFMVVCHADDRETATKVANAAFRVAEELNATASDYLPESELSMLSSMPVAKPIPLSPLLYGLLEHSRRMAEATGGAFDPTLGPLTRLWRETRDQRRLPDAEKLRSARERTGWRNFTLDPESQTITLHRENMAFDLGAVAKGYAADLMLESLAEHGIRRAMIAAGGEIRLGDAPPERDGWRVAVQTFDPARPDDIVVLSNAAVSTSGDLYQSVEIDGIRYSHILSPPTGLGLKQRVAAMVIADEAKLSDALSTAACVLGPDSSEQLRHFPGLRELKVMTPQESLVRIPGNIPSTH